MSEVVEDIHALVVAGSHNRGGSAAVLTHKILEDPLCIRFSRCKGITSRLPRLYGTSVMDEDRLHVGEEALARTCQRAVI